MRFVRTTSLTVLMLAVGGLVLAAPSVASAGSVVAWGWNQYGQCNAPYGYYNFTAGGAGYYHSMILKDDGSLYAWGNNNYGQSSEPSGTDFVDIAACYLHSLALKSDGTVVGWGNNADGQCNVPSGSQGDFVAITGGSNHSLGLLSTGSLVVWGGNDYGQIDNVPAGTDFTTIAANGRHCLAIKSDGSLVAWGRNTDGQCDVSSGDYLAIGAGWYHSLAVKSDGSLVAWGYNGDGQCDVPSGTDFVAVAGGARHSLALKSDGSLAAWGRNSEGQCNVPSGNDFVAIAAGGYHSVGVTDLECVSPSIVTQPSGATLCYMGTSVSHQMCVVASGSPPLSYQWLSHTGQPIYGATSSCYTPTFNQPGSGTYRCAVYNPCGGSTSTDLVTVSVVIPYEPSTPTVTHYCGYSRLTRGSPPSGETWYWQTASSGTDTSNSASTWDVTASGTYYLRSRMDSSPHCWSYTRSIGVTVYNDPSAPSAPSQTHNCGNTVLTRGSPPSGETWYWQGTSCGTSTSDSAETYTVTSPGTYYLRARLNSSAQCWSPSCTSVSVTVNTVPPTPSTPSQTSYNCGNTVLTRGSPPSGVTWYWQGTSCGTSTADSAATYTANSSGTYYLRARDNTSGCWSSCSSVSVTVYDNPSTPSTPTATNYCGYTRLSRGTPPSGVTWYWQTSAGGTSTSNSASTWDVTASGTYYLRARRDSSPYCWSSSSASVAVSVWSIPSNPSPSANPSAICDGNSTDLSASVSDAVIDWYTGSCGGTFVATGNSISVSPVANTTYYARARNSSSGCTSLGCGSVMVTVNANPTATASNNGPVCQGSDVTLSSGPGGMTSYAWTGPNSFTSGEQNPVVSPAVAGQYCVTVTDGNGCTDSACTDVAVDTFDTDGDGIADCADIDDDNDGVPDGSDPASLDPDLCGDSDGDSCDDCSVGTDNFGPQSDQLPDNDGTDTDGDGFCDAGDTDDDGDGVPDGDDSHPLDQYQCRDVDGDTCDDCSSGTDNPANDGTDTDGDGLCDAGDTDDDNDGVADGSDSHPLDQYRCRDVDGDTCDDCFSGIDNPANDGTDTDGDGLCDDGDTDDDNDGVADGSDLAPSNPDLCGDSDGDSCDDCSVGTDDFGPLSDQLPGNDGADFDSDGACDAGDTDIDNDGRLNVDDSDDFNQNICADTDADGCDDCSSGTFAPANDGADFDGDGLCDAGDPDIDNDGRLNADDSDTFNPNVCADTDADGCDDCSSGTFAPANDGTDTDGDGLCDTGDPDDDNDGVLDDADSNSLDPDICEDADGDGCDDCSVGIDDFGPLPDNDPANDGTDTDGDGLCDAGDTDDDNDGVLDDADSNSLDPNICEDADGDGCDDCSVGTDDFGPLADNDPSNDGTDTDGDGICDNGDSDDDNDSVLDGDDSDPLDPYLCQDTDADDCDDCSQTGGPPDPANDGTDTDSDGLCDTGDTDDDGDGVADGDDSHPLDPYQCRDLDSDSCDDCSSGTDNPANDGTDTDGDGLCDDGDTDDDNDGVLDAADTNSLDPDLCEDTDGDGCDDCSVGTDDFGPLADNDPANDGTDTDSDGLCDAGDPDDDNDGVLDGDDTDPLNPDVCEDTDGDGCDDCSVGTDDFGPLADNDPSNDGLDTDSNGICDAGDTDDDGDGVPDGDDSHPLDQYQCRDVDGDTCDDCAGGTDDPSNDGTDTDSDGLCDAGDTDDDNDGVLDGDDTDPLDPDVCEDTDGDGCDDCSVGTDDFGPLADNNPANDGTDTDGDGICNAGDNCPDHANSDQADCDNDGTGDVCAIATGGSEDCNFNGVPDECDIAVSTSEDCNSNSIPDECDISDGTSEDYNTNGIPDECEPAFGQLLLRTGEEPGVLCVDTEDTFTVTLEVADLGYAINGVQALIHYDAAYLSLVSITPATGWTLITPDGGNPDPDGDGDLTCALYLPGGETSAAGTVATLLFDPIGEGATSVTFQSDDPPFHTKLTRAYDNTAILPDKIDSGTISIDNTVAIASNNGPIFCEGDTIELSGGPSSGPLGPYTYSWTGPDDFSSSEQSPTISDATLGMTGTYYLTVANVNGCEFTAQTDITVELCMVVNVEIEGLIGNSGSYGLPSSNGSEIDREVTFVFTDCDDAAETFVVPVTFTADTGNNKGVGSVRLTGLDAGFDWLGVQEGHTLRTLVAVDFVGTLADSVTVFLTSGDFHTAIVLQDNLVDITDFSILASNWETAIGADQSTGGDATGDGYHDADDFALIQPNFFVMGDAIDGCSRVGRVPPAALQVGVVSRTPRAGISVSELSLTVAHAERADVDGNGVIDARDIRAFARRHNLPLQPAFDAKLLELEAELIELEPAVDSELQVSPHRTR